MSRTSSLYARISRRETHSPRSVIAITLAVITILATIWIGTEMVLALFALPPLLVAPVDMFGALLGLSDAPEGLVAAAGIVVAIIGLLLLVVAVSPGRRARHSLDTERAATVVDDEVIASALARHASLAGDVDPDNTSVSVSRRRALVRLTPTSGYPVDQHEVAEVVARQLESYRLQPRISARVRIAERSKVGA